MFLINFFITMTISPRYYSTEQKLRTNHCPIPRLISTKKTKDYVSLLRIESSNQRSFLKVQKRKLLLNGCYLLIPNRMDIEFTPTQDFCYRHLRTDKMEQIIQYFSIQKERLFITQEYTTNLEHFLLFVLNMCTIRYFLPFNIILPNLHYKSFKNSKKDNYRYNTSMGPPSYFQLLAPGRLFSSL